MLHPSLRRRLRTNDWQLRYRLLQHDFFGENLVARTKSRCGNKYTEVLFTNFGWSSAFPMDKKGDAHEDLSMLFQWDGVPTKMIVDGSKEQTLGYFKCKVAEAVCHLR